MSTTTETSPALPIPGMTKRIAYHHVPLMSDGFCACVSATVSQPGAIEAFIKATGHTFPKRAGGISAMVDQACGFDPMAASMAKFADWVAETVWGLEGSEGTEPEEKECS